jgi:CrcB protein
VREEVDALRQRAGGAFRIELAGDTWLRSALTIGLLGAHTTFSTLSYETYRLLEDGALGLAAANVLGSAAAGLVAVYLGILAGRAL